MLIETLSNIIVDNLVNIIQIVIYKKIAITQPIVITWTIATIYQQQINIVIKAIAVVIETIAVVIKAISIIKHIHSEQIVTID